MRTRTQSTVLSALLTPALLLLGLAWLVAPAGPAAATRLPKVEVCHIPPGNPANAHTLNVSENALPAHLRHGDFAVGDACSEGVGECRSEGITQCDAADSCSAVPGEPSGEVCDGLDNDCNGVADDNLDDVGECTAGVGECAVDGNTVCTEGGLECDAIPADPPENTETSCGDGRDNDCDGLIDAQDTDCAIPCFDPIDIAGFGALEALSRCDEQAMCDVDTCVGAFAVGASFECDICSIGIFGPWCDICAEYLIGEGCGNVCVGP